MTSQARIIIAEAGIETLSAFLKTSDPIIVGAPAAKITSRRLDGDALLAEIEALSAAGEDFVLTPVDPISPFEASLEREQLAGWLLQADAAARAEGGKGVIIGFDPTEPSDRATLDDVASDDEDEVSVRGGQLFRWANVVRASATKGSDSAEFHLVDGTSVHLHADVDWVNRLS
jgi:hypothetical protein